jgi:allantoinase
VAFTPETNDFLAEAGLTWHTDVTYEDLPFRVHTPHGDIAAVPTTDFSDNRVMKSNPRDFFDAHKGTFDFLERRESQSLLVLVMHAQFGGRPIMTSIIEDVLNYVAKSPDVWFARHDQLAEWALKSDRDFHSYADRYFSPVKSISTAK